MNTPTEKSEWTKDLGGIWFLCLLVGFFTWGIGLFITTYILKEVLHSHDLAISMFPIPIVVLKRF